MDTIFTVKAEHLARLSSTQAVDFFRELLWAEATRIGIGKHLISVPTAITVKDGGIDAEIRDVPTNAGQGIIKQGFTSYQIKTGKFSLRDADKVRKILFTPRSNGTALEPRVKGCLDRNGTFILVLFGWDVSENEPGEFVGILRSALRDFDPKYTNAKIEVWQPNQILGFLEPFPSLALKVNGNVGLFFQTHHSWSEQREMRRPFKVGEAQSKFLSDLQMNLRQDHGAVHLYIRGEPGIGKTRLALEATRTDDLAPLIIYYDSPEAFKHSSLMNELLKKDNQFSCILVIDECDFQNRTSIWDKLRERGRRIKLVTIYNEFEAASGSTLPVEVPLLNDSQISDIILDYVLVKDHISRWVEFCSGSPRVAHVLGQNLKENPKNLLLSPDTVDLWGRYIAGSDNLASEEVRQRRDVLRCIALFKRFGFAELGYAEPGTSHARVIAAMIQRADTSITWERFQAIVKTLKDRKILQGTYTLYITPKLLHIKLWAEWWETYGREFSLETFLQDVPDTSSTLREWFYEMFKYAAESEVAHAVVEKLLGPYGPFQNHDYLQTYLGARFFLALTEANPKAALVCLRRTIGRSSKEKLFAFTTGRREVVWALERIAMWRELFTGAAQLLLALGEAENESYANNASGVFTELFSLAPGEVAPTQAPPQERLPVLKQALKSLSKERRLLAIHACNKALESQYFYRDVGAEYQGLRHVPNLWMPQTYGELFEAYRQVWQLLFRQLEGQIPVDEQQLITTILLQRAQGLAKYLALADMVIDTVGGLLQKSYVDEKKVLADIIRILHYDGSNLPEHVRQRWEQLRDALVRNDFSSQMRRYVGMDVLEDYFDAEGNRVDQVQVHLEALAQQVINAPELLQAELPWLVTTEAQNGFRFGYELGQRDFAFSLLPLLLSAQRDATDNPSVFFLAGYLRVLFEKDRARWEEEADILAQDEMLRVWLPELTWRAGLTDRAALRLLKLAQENSINIGSFRLFSTGRVIQMLSEDIFHEWLQLLLTSKHPHAISIALDTYYVFYVDVESKYAVPEDLTLSVLTHQVLLQTEREVRLDPMDYHYWAEIGRSFAQLYPESSLTLADWMLEHFGMGDTILEHYSETLSVLNVIAEHHPKEVWERIAPRLGSKLENTRALYITSWLRGENNPVAVHVGGALTLFPLEAVWQWIDEDVELRAAYLASFVPKTLLRQEKQVCLAREVLIHYGERDDVRQAFSANYFTGSWWGPISQHYEGIKQNLLDFRKTEEDENVTLWIDEYIEELDNFIEHEKFREERDAF